MSPTIGAMPELYSTEHEREAYRMGADAGIAAASWVVDGNTSALHIEHVLYLIEGGDPQADEYLPARPNLSGEWADAPTPQSLAADILGAEWETRQLWEQHGYNTPDFIRAEVVDAIADAWEEGVRDTFASECERILRAALPDETEEN